MAAVTPTLPPPPSPSPEATSVSPIIFAVSSVLNVGVTFGAHKIFPDLSPNWYPVITTGTSVATFCGLQRFGLISNYKLLSVGRSIGVIGGISIGSSFLMDSTLGYIPYLGKTFEPAGTLNLLVTSFLSFSAPLLFPKLVFSPSATLTRLITGAIGAKVLAAGLILAIEMTAFSLVNSFLLNPIDSLINYGKGTDTTTAKMDQLVWEAELKEAAHSKLPRPLANFATNHLGYFVKGGAKLTEWFSSESHQNRDARRARMHALLISEFSEWERSNISQAIINSIVKEDGKEKAKIDWSSAAGKIKQAYQANPNVKLFYEYNYSNSSIDTRWFSAGKNRTEQIQKVKDLVDQEGDLDLREVESVQKEVNRKKISLLDLAIEEFPPIDQKKLDELRENYPPELLGSMSEEEQNANLDISEYRVLDHQSKQLERLKKIREELLKTQ